MDEKEKGEHFGNCDACGKEVIGERQACQAMEKIYHSDCFVCCACGRSLKEKEFYNVNGTIYCEEDYLVSVWWFFWQYVFECQKLHLEECKGQIYKIVSFLEMMFIYLVIY